MNHDLNLGKNIKHYDIHVDRKILKWFSITFEKQKTVCHRHMMV